MEVEWISIKDRLPEINQYGSSDEILLIMSETYEEGENADISLAIGWIDNGVWHTSLDCFEETNAIPTHWAKFPKFPKQ
jgi:hypothetical protein